MSSGKRSSYDMTTAVAVGAPAEGEQRPLSFYDNLTTGSGNKIIQIPDIQFKFYEDAHNIEELPCRSTVRNDARSDFFGLSKRGASADAVDSEDAAKYETDETRQLMSEFATSSSSPTSTASTAPARSGTPDESPGSKSRPISSHRNITIKLPDDGTPSEAVYMTTTVPQNFAKNASSLIGRHKPTRSSLRHSRMLVVNKSYHQRYPKGNSLNLKHIRLSRTLMVLKIVIGAILTFVGMAIMVWSPNTHTKDNPYWAGLILILCGALFLILFDFKRRPANRLRENCYNFIRVNALVVLLLTIFFTMLAFIYALIHTTNLTSSHLRCEPEYSFNVNSSRCVCLIDTHSVVDESIFGESAGEGDEEGGSGGNATRGTVISGMDLRRAAEQLEDEGVIRLEYRDFSCSEVLGIWFYVTLGSTILNSVACLLAALFLVIYGVECQRREQELKYYSVRTTSNGNGIKLTERTDEDEEKAEVDSPIGSGTPTEDGQTKDSKNTDS